MSTYSYSYKYYTGTDREWNLQQIDIIDVKVIIFQNLVCADFKILGISLTFLEKMRHVPSF